MDVRSQGGLVGGTVISRVRVGQVRALILCSQDGHALIVVGGVQVSGDARFHIPVQHTSGCG